MAKDLTYGIESHHTSSLEGSARPTLDSPLRRVRIAGASGKLGLYLAVPILAAALTSAGCGEEPMASDIDECATDNGGCGAPESATCTNNPGAAPTCTAVPTLDTTGLRADAPPYAVHGPFWVGHRQFEAAGDPGAKPLSIRAWYPALNPTRAKEEVTYQFTPHLAMLGGDTPFVVHGHAILDAPIDATKGARPLVIFSHGYSLNPEWYSTLLEHYASQGFIVLAPQHAEDDWLEAWAATFDRPLDIKRALDFAEGLTAPGGELAGKIDMTNVAVVGHSYGGYTALAMAGAQLELDTFHKRCAALAPDAPEGFLCAPFVGREKDMAARAGLSSVPQGLWPALGDSRIKAIVPIAGSAFLFNAGLASIKVPMMAIGGTADSTGPWEWTTGLSYDNVSSAHKALVGIENAEHMIPINPCDMMPWSDALDPFTQGYLCLDPVWDRPRTLDLINHFSTAFLLDVLTGDTAAHQALSSDAVQLPGIGYTTTLQ